MPSWIDRIRVWTELGFKDPDERVERVMIRVLLLGNAGLALIGLFDFLREHTARSAVQFVAACLFVLLILWMDRTGHVYPRTLLALAALGACTTLVSAGVSENTYFLTDPEPIMFLATTGVLAVILGGKHARAMVALWAVLVATGVAAARWPTTQSYGQVVSDVATVLVILGLTFAAIVAVQRAVRQGRAQYEQLMETAPVGIVEFDLHSARNWMLENGYRTLEQYQAAVEGGSLDPRAIVTRVVVSGYNETAGNDLYLDRPPGPVEEVGRESARIMADVLARAIFEDEPGSAELSFEVEGEVYHRVFNWSVDSPERRSAVVIATDITAQKAAEKALSDEITNKNQFIAAVSHELRTPLTVVVGLVDELSRPDAVIDDSEREELMKIVTTQAHEVAGIVEDLLVAARAADGRLSTVPVEFEIGDAITSTLELFNTRFDYDIAGDLTVYADPSRVRQVVRNLASNAIRYGGPNRRVTSHREQDMATIEIRDDGPPIPNQRRNVIFEPYGRARDQVRPDSVGLGLTVARSLVESMGGTLVYDHDGGESVFRFTLPTNAGAAAEA
jgi:signal transduction histidine kinase